jgi:hypothetical protein
MENKIITPDQNTEGQHPGKLVHMVIRLLGGREVNVGEMLLVERGRNKAVCQVIWTADPKSALRGQFTVHCVDEGKTPWDEELRVAEEQYQALTLEAPSRISSSGGFGAGEANRRRRPRFHVEGTADVMDGVQKIAGQVREISEFGARIAAQTHLSPGSDFRLMLNMLDVSLALKAQVKYRVADSGLGVEFQEIRRGDRPLLSYVLSKLKMRRAEGFTRAEVVTEPLVAFAG